MTETVREKQVVGIEAEAAGCTLPSQRPHDAGPIAAQEALRKHRP